MKKMMTKLKAYLQKISKNKFFKFIRAVSLGILLLVAFLRIFFTMATMIVTILVLRVGYGQGGDLPVRRDAGMYDAIRYWYDEQGRLKEEVHFDYITLSDGWPLIIAPMGLFDDDTRLIFPFPNWREVWVYEEDSLDKTQYIYDSYFTDEENLQAVITYRHELDEQGRIGFYEKSVDYHQAIQNGYIIHSFRPEKFRYEYDTDGNISIIYDLNAYGEVYQYYVYTYENDLLVRKDLYFAADNRLSTYDLYFYDNGILVRKENYWTSEKSLHSGINYEYDKEGRLIAEKGEIYYYYRYYY